MRYDDKTGRPFGEAPTTDHPFVVRCFTTDPRDSDGVVNGLSFETIEDAEQYAYDLMMRWFGLDHYTIENALTGETVRL